MLKTLYWYISRELLRVTGLALVAFTLVMTVFAIVEPLRKQGLAAGQVAGLFLYTLPAMLSLTMPFAALFATTIIYGRFTQDRELLACRASGISTLRLLQPALALGAGVTLLSLLLTNFLAPYMLKMAKQTAIRNIKGIAYHKIEKEGQFDIPGKGIVHADWVDREEDALHGVVAARTVSRPDPETGIQNTFFDVMVASKAYIKTWQAEDPQFPGRVIHYLSLDLEDPVGPITHDVRDQVAHGELMWKNTPLPDPSEDKPAFYNWDQLLATYREPSRHGEIRRKMKEIVRDVRLDRVVADLVRVANGGGEYDKLVHPDGRRLAIRAPRASLVEKDAVLTGGRTPDGAILRVEVREQAPGETAVTYWADRCVVAVRYNEALRTSKVTVALTGQIESSRPVPLGREAASLAKKSWGDLLLPDDPEMERDNHQQLVQEVYDSPEAFTENPILQGRVAALKRERSGKILGEILAEMNLRLAFGVSCVLLVALGAALGVVFRGGQMIAAFTLSVLPAAAMLVLIFMGKKMISNPKSSDEVGLCMIWGSLLAMLLGDLVIYYRLSRK